MMRRLLPLACPQETDPLYSTTRPADMLVASHQIDPLEYLAIGKHGTSETSAADSRARIAFVARYCDRCGMVGLGLVGGGQAREA